MNDIEKHILIRYLRHEDILSLCDTSVIYRDICDDPYTWEYLLERDYNIKFRGSNARDIYERVYDAEMISRDKVSGILDDLINRRSRASSGYESDPSKRTHASDIEDAIEALGDDIFTRYQQDVTTYKDQITNTLNRDDKLRYMRTPAFRNEMHQYRLKYLHDVYFRKELENSGVSI